MKLITRLQFIHFSFIQILNFDFYLDDNLLLSWMHNNFNRWKYHSFKNNAKCSLFRTNDETRSTRLAFYPINSNLIILSSSNVYYKQFTCSSVCPSSQVVHRCSPLLCYEQTCMANQAAVCRINPCGNCTIEFYDKDNNAVDCMKGL